LLKVKVSASLKIWAGDATACNGFDTDSLHFSRAHSFSSVSFLSPGA